MLRSTILAATVTLALALPAFADAPADLAAAHIKAVAAGDVAKITATYSADSNLYWVGGKLNGTYTGPQQITAIWDKFSKLGPLKVSVKNMQESANPAGATVTADVVFQGKMPIKVRYVMLYRAGMLINEIWQIDPKMAY